MAVTLSQYRYYSEDSDHIKKIKPKKGPEKVGKFDQRKIRDIEWLTVDCW